MVGRKSAVPEEVVIQWKHEAEASRAAGLAWRPICEELAGEAYNWQTVYRYLCPDVRERQRESSRRAYQESESRREERRKQARAEYKRVYERHRRRIERHPERYVEKIFDRDAPLGIEDIGTKLGELCEGLRFHTRTVEGILRRYQLTQLGTAQRYLSIDETRPGVWSKCAHRT